MRSKNTNTLPRTQKAPKKAARAPQLRRLASSDMRHLAKPKAGFAAHMEPLLQLLAQYGDELGKCPVDPAAMRAALADVQRLTVQRQQQAEQLALLDNTIFADGSSVWTQMLDIYSHAKVAARNNADIRALLQSFEQFMKTGPRKKPGTPATATT